MRIVKCLDIKVNFEFIFCTLFSETLERKMLFVELILVCFPLKQQTLLYKYAKKQYLTPKEIFVSLEGGGGGKVLKNLISISFYYEMNYFFLLKIESYVFLFDQIIHI